MPVLEDISAESMNSASPYNSTLTKTMLDLNEAEINRELGRGSPISRFTLTQASETQSSAVIPSIEAVGALLAEADLAQSLIAKSIVSHASSLHPSTPKDSGSSSSTRASSQEPVERKPGDYLTHPALLARAYSAWVTCINCESKFVQPDSYQVRAYCDRCERHRILYGFKWPKTDKVGKWDKEERVLDHREIHKFISPLEERAARKGELEMLDLSVAKRKPMHWTQKAKKKKRLMAKPKVEVKVRRLPSFSPERRSERVRKARIFF
jgi:hypothetical protein